MVAVVQVMTEHGSGNDGVRALRLFTFQTSYFIYVVKLIIENNCYSAEVVVVVVAVCEV